MKTEKKRKINKIWEKQLFDALYGCWVISSLLLNNHWFLLANSLSLYPGNGIPGQGISLWPVWASCPGHAPSLLLCSFSLQRMGGWNILALGWTQFHNYQNTSVLSTSFSCWIQNTALFQLLRGKFSLSQVKSVNFPGPVTVVGGQCPRQDWSTKQNRPHCFGTHTTSSPEWNADISLSFFIPVCTLAGLLLSLMGCDSSFLWEVPSLGGWGMLPALFSLLGAGAVWHFLLVL